MYEHGGVAVRLGPPTDRWDSGEIGIYVVEKPGDGSPGDGAALTGAIERELRIVSAWLNNEAFDAVEERRGTGGPAARRNGRRSPRDGWARSTATTTPSPACSRGRGWTPTTKRGHRRARSDAERGVTPKGTGTRPGSSGRPTIGSRAQAVVPPEAVPEMPVGGVPVALLSVAVPPPRSPLPRRRPTPPPRSGAWAAAPSCVSSSAPGAGSPPVATALGGLSCGSLSSISAKPFRADLVSPAGGGTR